MVFYREGSREVDRVREGEISSYKFVLFALLQSRHIHTYIYIHTYIHIHLALFQYVPSANTPRRRPQLLLINAVWPAMNLAPGDGRVRKGSRAWKNER